ncbi:MAG: hypothetical protein LBH29_04415 [Elusimicrobiota bacterium]|jgi:hypothetical protein|nr:hypothetical protein [Elusimicrobiota bacterium]
MKNRIAVFFTLALALILSSCDDANKFLKESAMGTEWTEAQQKKDNVNENNGNENDGNSGSENNGNGNENDGSSGSGNNGNDGNNPPAFPQSISDSKVVFEGYFDGKELKITVFYVPQRSPQWLNPTDPQIITNAPNDKTVKLLADKEYGLFIEYEVDGQFIYRQHCNAEEYRDSSGSQNTSHLVYYDPFGRPPCANRRYESIINNREGTSAALDWEYTEIGAPMQRCLGGCNGRVLVQTYRFNAGARKDLNISFRYKPAANGVMAEVYNAVLHIEVD